MLLDNLIMANLGNVAAYRNACKKVNDFILQYPMKTGYWTDGHTDTNVNGNTYKSNMGASNMALYIFDHPEFDPNWKTDLPMMIKWTEDNFVARCVPGEPAHQWGANIVGEQDDYLPKMDYQTARYAAQCARWYAISGDEAYKEKAYRSLNWVTYCSDSKGLAFESPLSKGVLSWWSDCYGECPRMFYQAFAAIPEFAPVRENHILYSEGIIKDVRYEAEQIKYTATSGHGTEYLRLAFKPSRIVMDKVVVAVNKNTKQGIYNLKELGQGDYALTISHKSACKIIVSKSNKIKSTN
jgi:hypothetical protein